MGIDGFGGNWVGSMIDGAARVRFGVKWWGRSRVVLL